MIESALIRCDVRWAHLAKPTKMRKEAKCHVQLRIHLKKIDGFRSLVCCLVGKLFMTLLYHFKNNFSRTFILSLFHFESIALWRMKKKFKSHFIFTFVTFSPVFNGFSNCGFEFIHRIIFHVHNFLFGWMVCVSAWKVVSTDFYHASSQSQNSMKKVIFFIDTEAPATW